MKEFSITAVIVGVLLAVVFGAANAYLGLRVGMTVSASIPGGGCINGDSARFAAPQFYLRK